MNINKKNLIPPNTKYTAVLKTINSKATIRKTTRVNLKNNINKPITIKTYITNKIAPTIK